MDDDSEQFYRDLLSEVPMLGNEHAAQTAASILDHLLKSGVHNDLTIRCQDVDFNVHKAIVCTQSPVLRTAMKSGFNEAQTGIYTIKEFPPSTVANIVKFMYTDTYPDYVSDDSKQTDDDDSNDADSIKVVDSPPVLIMDACYNYLGREYGMGRPEIVTCVRRYRREAIEYNISVNSIADYFQIEALKDLSRRRILYYLEMWKIVSAISMLDSDLNETPGIKAKEDSSTFSSVDRGQAVMVDFLQFVRLVYDKTGDRELYDSLAKFAAKNLPNLCRDVIRPFESFDSIPGFPALVLGHLYTEFATLSKARSDLKLDKLVMESAAKAAVLSNDRLIKALETLDMTSLCRHCGLGFNGIVDRIEMMIRCRGCRTRHYNDL